MATTNITTHNIELLNKAFDTLQEQFPDQDMQGAKPLFLTPIQEKSLDLALLGIHYTEHPEGNFALWTIICCGCQAMDYAQEIQASDSDLNVLIHDEQGTTSIEDCFGELFTITVII